MTTHDEIAALLAAPEGARLEFKAARGGFHFEELVKYVVALANEGGGAIVFGVEDERRGGCIPGASAHGSGPARCIGMCLCNKALLLQHIRTAGAAGCPISELQQVLPALARDQVKRLLGELRDAGHVQLVGTRRGARWALRYDE